MKKSQAKDNISAEGMANPEVKGRNGKWHGPAKIIAISLGAIIGFMVLILCAISLFLTPERLTSIVNREASLYLNADVKASNIQYSIWSSFPRFDIHTDSIQIISRSLNGVSPDIRKTLPTDADFLASLKSFSGSINIVDLFLNRYVIHDVKVDGLNINLVAYNDSINNYNIIPSGGPDMKSIPYISAKSVELVNPGNLRYISVASDTRASLNLSRLALNHRKGKDSDNLYHLFIGGKVNASSAGLTILNGFPFEMDGDIRLKFKPFAIRLIDYDINLGELKSKLSMSIGIGDNPSLESFDYRISSVNLMSLLGYIPKEYIPSLQGINTDMVLSASARLTSAWDFSSTQFPSVRIDFTTPAGQLDYSVALPAQGSNPASASRIVTYPLNYSAISGIFNFNGSNPDKSYVEIPRFTVSTDGIEVGVEAKITDLTSLPAVAANVEVNSDLRKSLSILPLTLPAQIDGNMAIASDINFNIASLTKEGLQQGFTNIDAAGDITLSDCRFSMPSANMKSHLSRMKIHFAEKASAITPDYVSDPTSSLSLHIEKLTGTSGQGNFKVDGLNIRTGNSLRGNITTRNVREGLPLGLSVLADKVTYTDPKSNTAVVASGTSISDSLATSRFNSLSSLLSDGFSFKSKEIALKADKDKFILHNPTVSLQVAERNNTINLETLGVANATASSASATSSPANTPVASTSGAAPAHTPEYVEVNIPEGVKEFMRDFRFNTALKADRIDIITPGADRNNSLRNIDITLNEEELAINNASMMLEKTRGLVTGKISNIRNFLTLPVSDDNSLDVNLALKVDTININSLAHTYAMAKGGIDKIQTKTEIEPSDSIAIMLPRNIKADITAHAKETIYMNLHLYDLNTKINLSGGIADIPYLNIATDFGNAALNLKYDTSDINNLNFGIAANMDDVNIVNFFKNFHGLLEMMPEMSNLSGMLSLGINAKGNIFPDMYLNMPSVTAGMDIEGWKLLLHQSKFIRKITRMMLIETSGDLHIKDIGIHATVGDNLLQLKPFDFEFDRYKLHAEGLNNFNGKLYYHLAVMKSPIPFPFSVNIVGMFHHPELRFGGAHFDTKRSESISAEIEENNNINIVNIARSFMGAFVKKAAEAAENPNLSL